MLTKYIKYTFSISVFLLATFAISSAATVNCRLTVNKSPQWKHETLTVKILNFYTKKPIDSLVLAAQKGQEGKTNFKASINTASKNFDCEDYPFIQLQASYTPDIWSSQKGKTFLSKNVYNLTSNLITAKKDNVQTIQISVDFPKDFVNVPMLVN